MLGFRVDANEKVATGHLMRCIAIAEACRKRGIQCIFLLAAEKETGRLWERKFPYRILNTRWNDPESEIDLLIHVVKEEKIDWLVVDTYEATPSYLADIERTVPVLYVDDFRRELYGVSAVLQYIPYGGDAEIVHRYQGTGTEVLAGLSYAPLREEFAMHSGKGIREKSILLTTGGTDIYNIAGRVLEHCQHQKGFEGYLFHVVVGSMNRHEEMLKELSQKNSNIVLHKNISNICDYMRQCEVALSAGGTTLLELCASRIPTVCFSFAENQRAFARGMGEEGVMRYAGDARECAHIETVICGQILFFLADEDNRRVYAERMGKLVDGRGAERIADWLLQKLS